MERSIKVVLKREGKPLKLKKLLALVLEVPLTEEELEDLDELPTKKTLKAACENMKKVHLEDGVARWGPSEVEAEEGSTTKSKKRKKEKDEDAAEEDNVDSKQSKKKKKKGKTEESEDAEAEDSNVEFEAKKKKKKKKKSKNEEDEDEDEDEDDHKKDDAESIAVADEGWNNWGDAKFEDNSRKNKFLRLMGAAKATSGDEKTPSGGKKGLFGGLSGTKRPVIDTIGSSTSMSNSVEQQFNQAFSMKGAPRAMGLGFTAAPKKNQWSGSKTKF